MGLNKKISRFYILGISVFPRMCITPHHNSHHACFHPAIFHVGMPFGWGGEAWPIPRMTYTGLDKVEEGKADRLDRLIYCGLRRKIRVLILQGEILNQDSEGSGLATSYVRKCLDERWLEKAERGSCSKWKSIPLHSQEVMNFRHWFQHLVLSCYYRIFFITFTLCILFVYIKINTLFVYHKLSWVPNLLLLVLLRVPTELCW